MIQFGLDRNQLRINGKRRMQNKLGQMKATFNDFIKKPWEIKEDSEP
jgi:hypothetical protein